MWIRCIEHQWGQILYNNPKLMKKIPEAPGWSVILNMRTCWRWCQEWEWFLVQKCSILAKKKTGKLIRRGVDVAPSSVKIPDYTIACVSTSPRSPSVLPGKQNKASWEVDGQHVFMLLPDVCVLSKPEHWACCSHSNTVSMTSTLRANKTHIH